MKKYSSLQALRAIALFGIFLNHAHAPVYWSGLGVAVFFVLSGFLLFDHHGNENVPISVKSCFLQSWNRIKKQYPLHILTMVLMIALLVLVQVLRGSERSFYPNLFRNIGLNVFLLQSWYPDSTVNASLNGVAWFLSAIAFSYGMFPLIRRWISGRSQSCLWLICLAVLGLEWGISVLLIATQGANSPVYIWCTYCFPVFRLGDFFIGCCLGKYHSETGTKTWSLTKGTAIESLALFGTLVLFGWMRVPQTSLVTRALHNWTTVYIPVAAVWVYLFTQKRGWITRILSNKLFCWFGNLSAAFYLIHYVVIQYVDKTLLLLKITLPEPVSYLVMAAEFSVSIGLSYAFSRWSTRAKEKKIHGKDQTALR